MADQNPKPDQQDRNVELPGDTDSADIVDRTGEQMPEQTHDGLETESRGTIRDDDAEVPAVERR